MNIKKLAEQAGFKLSAWKNVCTRHSNGSFVVIEDELERFAELIRQDERGKYYELIKIMERAIHDIGGEWGYDYPTVVDARSEIAAITERSNHEQT